MENTNPNDKPNGGCGVMEGALPGSCADMVFPFVAMQRENAQRYGQREALFNGTLFPGLNLPFFKTMKTRMNCDNDALCELMALAFAVNELGLYLDTHKDDREALALYRRYANMAKEGRKRYEEMYGPLMQSSVGGENWNWLSDPWPWDVEGGRK